jgi:hypothetical protein
MTAKAAIAACRRQKGKSLYQREIPFFFIPYQKKSLSLHAENHQSYIMNMVHIQNMEYSLLAVQSLFKLIKEKGWSLPDMLFYRYQCDFDFLDASAYLLTVKEYLLTKPDNKPLKKTLQKHLDMLKSILSEKIETDKTAMERLYCRFYKSTTYPVREVYFWEEQEGLGYKTTTPPIQTDWTGNYLPAFSEEESQNPSGVDIYKHIRKEDLYDKVCEVMNGLEFLLGDASEETDNTRPPTINISDKILKLLAETTCTDGNPFIENATDFPVKWLQNKQLARELVTHNSIRGKLSVAEIERRTPATFIYHKDSKPLELAKDKPTTDKRDSNRLTQILANL